MMSGIHRAAIGCVALLSTLAVSACAAPPPPAPAPTVDAAQVASTARRRSQLDQPTRIRFHWRLKEQDARFSGEGVARIQPPDRVRLDLFLGNGETMAKAALVGDDLRIPPGVNEKIIPPPHLLWGTLGIFRPGGGAALLGGTDRQGDGILLRYGFAGGEELRYTLKDARIDLVELLQDGHVVKRVELEREAEGEEAYPKEAVYRDISAFVELSITRESVEYVDSFAPDIWNPVR